MGESTFSWMKRMESKFLVSKISSDSISDENSEEFFDEKSPQQTLDNFVEKNKTDPIPKKKTVAKKLQEIKEKDIIEKFKVLKSEIPIEADKKIDTDSSLQSDSKKSKIFDENFNEKDFKKFSDAWLEIIKFEELLEQIQSKKDK
jgi:hypothetical protein